MRRSCNWNRFWLETFKLPYLSTITCETFRHQRIDSGSIEKTKDLSVWICIRGNTFSAKQEDKLWEVIDYRALNRITKLYIANLPRKVKMFDRFRQPKYFSKLDLMSGFYQIRASLKDVKNTTFKNNYGHFQFLVVPVSLKNAPATFPALMNFIFCYDIDKYVVVYFDDILIFSNLRRIIFVTFPLRWITWKKRVVCGKEKVWTAPYRDGVLGLKLGMNGIE